MRSTVSDKLTFDALEQHQLGDIVEVHERTDFRRIRTDRNPFGDNGNSERKLDRLANWTQHFGHPNDSSIGIEQG